MTFSAVRDTIMGWGSTGFPYALEVLLAVLLDWAAGGIPCINPSRWMGFLIGKLEGLFKKRIDGKPSLDRASDERTYGLWLIIITLLASMAFAWAVPFGLSFINDMAASIGRIVVIFFALGTRSLFTSARKVVKAIQSDDKTAARSIVGTLTARDTDKLSMQGIARITCEAVAINSCDVVVAPLLYTIIGYSFFFGMGPAFAWGYMASQVLSARLARDNARNIDFGYYAQKVSGFLGVFPARLTGLALAGAAFLTGRNGKRSFTLMMNENANASDVNSGWVMAPVSGALGVKMGGGAYYGGIWKASPTIGFDTKTPEAGDILASLGLMAIAQALCLLLGLISANAMIILIVIVSVFDMYRKIKRFGGFGGGMR